MSDQPQEATSERVERQKPRAEDVTVRDLRREDVDAAVQIHMQAFPGFFLTFLGPSFLRQLYLAYCDNPTTVAIVAVREKTGEILGVAIGALQPASFYRKLLVQRWLRFGLAALGAMLRKPSIIPRILRAVRYRGDSPEDETNRALFASAAVSPAAQGMGVGKLLNKGFLAGARNAGLPGAYLTTDADNNDAVNAFHQRQGWKLTSSFTTPENRKMNLYFYDFENPTGD